MRKLRPLSLALAALAILVTAPAWAGTVYVPLVVDVVQEGNLVQTEIVVTNNSQTELKAFTYLVLRSNTDGTERDEGDGTEILLQPRTTFVLKDLVNAGQRAMVEINADDEIAVAARLMTVAESGDERLPTRVPVATSENLTPGGQPGYLQGWTRFEGLVTTDFHIINLGHQEASCTGSLVNTEGFSIVENVPFSIRPLSQRSIPDVLGAVGLGNVVDVSAVFVCDQPFFPYSTALEHTTGEVNVQTPSASGRSSLLPPGQVEPPEDGAVVFEVPGVFHRPTVGNESKRFDIAMPGNPRFRKIILDMDFTHGGWNTPQSDNHAIFWLNRGDRWRSNLFGYVNAFGPGRDIVKMASNVGLPAGVIRAKDTRIRLTPGSTYHVHFEYDTVANRYSVVLTEGGQQVAQVVDIPTVNTINTVGNNWFVAFGHEPHAVGPEVPTYGWTYANLRVQWVP